METKILVPVDDSKTTAKTIDAIIARKERFPVTLTLLHVIDLGKLAYRMIPEFQLEMVREQALLSGQQVLDGYRSLLERAEVRTESRLQFGSPREIICRIADEEGFELLILGRRGLGEIRDVLFGSVVNHALHHVRCPVLLF